MGPSTTMSPRLLVSPVDRRVCPSSAGGGVGLRATLPSAARPLVGTAARGEAPGTSPSQVEPVGRTDQPLMNSLTIAVNRLC